MFRLLIALAAGAARFLLFGLALLFASRLLGRALRRSAGPAPPKPAPPAEKLVADPVCGVRLPRDRAVVLERGGETLFFCSESCRRRFSELRSGAGGR